MGDSRNASCNKVNSPPVTSNFMWFINLLTKWPPLSARLDPVRTVARFVTANMLTIAH